jgi:hypothetical protein
MLEYLPTLRQKGLGMPGPHRFYHNKCTWESSYLLCHQGLLYHGKAPHDAPIPTPEPIGAVSAETLSPDLQIIVYTTETYVLGQSGQAYRVWCDGEWHFSPSATPHSTFSGEPRIIYDLDHSRV